MSDTSTQPDIKSDQNSGKTKSRRRVAREFLVQGIYQWRVAGGHAASIEQQLRESEDFKQIDTKHFAQVLHGVIQHGEALEQTIQPYLDRPLNELSPVEAAILYLSTYELIHHPEIPYRSIINEAIELAKTYGGTDGHKYVNGVLDKLALKLRSVEIQAHKHAKNN